MINKNESLPNRHTVYVGNTGSGKTQAMGQDEHLKNKKNGGVFWDTHGSFKAKQFSSMPALLRELEQASKKGSGYRLAYTGPKSERAFNALCNAVKAVSDGNKTLVFVVDEFASICDGIAKDKTPFGDILRESRKFGVIVLCSATRAAEITKTVFTCCQTKVVGAQGSLSDAKVLSDFLQLDKRLLLDTELKPLEFWVKRPAQIAEKITYKYKKPPL